MSAGWRGLSFVAIVVFAAALFPLQSWIDERVPPERPEADALYLTNGEHVKILALGYDSLLADVYWARAIQFLGREVLADRRVLNDPAGRLDLLYPLTDLATTLAPHDIGPYRFGGYFVHDYVDKARGRALLEKGIRNNPQNPRLYQDLAYLSWLDGDCATASRLYAEGARLPGARPWMQELSATILARCGRADLTVEMLARQYEATDDPRVREELAVKLKRYIAVLDVQYLARAAQAYRERTGAFPASLAQLARTLEPQPGAPRLRTGPGGTLVDPNGVPYVYDPSTGAVTTNPESIELPRSTARGAPPAGG